MMMRLKRHCIEIIPDGFLDEAFLEEVLGLKNNGDLAVTKRRNAMGLSSWGCLEITKGRETNDRHAIPTD